MLLLPLCVAINVKGQTQNYGIIDTADLKLTACDFEKDANAMVLFDKTEIKTEGYQTVIIRHRREKKVNNKGLDASNVSIAYFSRNYIESVKKIEAQTINLENGKIKFPAVNKEELYK